MGERDKIAIEYWKQFGKALYGCLETVFKGDAKPAKKWLESHGIPNQELGSGPRFAILS
jgi:hypothetical protein